MSLGWIILTFFTLGTVRRIEKAVPLFSASDKIGKNMLSDASRWLKNVDLQTKYSKWVMWHEALRRISRRPESTCPAIRGKLSISSLQKQKTKMVHNQFRDKKQLPVYETATHIRNWVENAFLHSLSVSCAKGISMIRRTVFMLNRGMARNIEQQKQGVRMRIEKLVIVSFVT